MDKSQAQKQIQDIFQHPFQRENYMYFLRNLLNQIVTKESNIHYTGNMIPPPFKDHVTQYWREAKYIDPDGIEMDLLVVEVKSLSKLDRARSTLRNFAVDRLERFHKDCSLIAFYSKEDNGADWRFSFVKREDKAELSDKGKVKFTKELTPAKRYSYLVGEHENSHTACQQLMPLLVMDYANPRIEEIEKAFSIEKVTDEFFEQYKGLYLKLSEQLKSQPFFKKETAEENTQTVARFAKKLLGQIVFLYFLQKKRWLGVEQGQAWGTGTKRFMRERFTEVTNNGGNYYHDFLQYLFYEALAKERKGQPDPDYYERFLCKIPFLNGGLFEAEYDWKDHSIDLPNDIFHNIEPNKAGDKGTGILDVFDRYNFTIKEDEPLEKEVAVDPEMLGKVFENMLEITERKSKGAFYTPREIVHYMCQESLINYLDNSLNSYAKLYQTIDSDQPILFGGLTDKKGQQKLEITHQDGIKVPKEDLEILIRKGHLFVENDEAALQALQRIESGEQKTTRHKIELPESIKSNAEMIDNYLESIRACDPAIGSGAFPVGLLHEIVNARLALAPHSGNSLSVYELKRHTIHESLYGVDIDASAVDIARLRLWLSLIVDEDDFSADKALPNLDYKIVCGNSLIGLPKNTLRDLQLEIELEKLKEEFFKPVDEFEKKNLRNQINRKLREFLNSSEQYAGYKIDFDFKLFFSEIWHKNADGFDVVIGNPPYGVSINGEYRKTVLKQFDKVPDYEIYYFFIELSKFLLSKNGVNSYIIPNTILFNVFANKYRQDLLNYWRVHEILDCTNFKIFESAVVRNIIYVFQKNQSGSIVGYRNTASINSFLDLINQEKKFITIDELLAFNQNWGLAFKLRKEVVEIIKKIKMASTALASLNPDISQGIIAYDKYRGQSEEIIKSRAYHFDEYRPGLKKWLLGEHVIRYKVIKSEQHYIDYCEGIANPRNPKFFNGERVLIREITNPRIYAAYTTEELYNDPALLIVKTDTGKINKYELTAILNSEVATFIHFNNSPKATKGDFPKILIEDIKNFPIRKPNPLASQALRVTLHYLEQLLDQPEKAIITSYTDQLINSIVYELYFPSEIKAANKEILKHLGVLKPINDDMSDEEKLAVIQSEFDRLYDPKHPVRNNLETLDSIEEVRIIREALKK
jgi:hypothetical protein